MKNWSLAARLYFLSFFLVSIILGSGVAMNYMERKMSLALQNFVERDAPTARNAGLIDMMHDGIRASVFRSLYLAELGDKAQMEDVVKEAEEFFKNINQYIENLEKLELAGDIRKKIDDVRPGVTEYIEVAGNIIKNAANGNVEVAKKEIPKLSVSFETLEKSLGELGDSIENDLNEQGKNSLANAKRDEWISLVILILGTLFGIGYSFFLIRGLVSQLRDITKTLNVSSEKFGKLSAEVFTAAKTLGVSSTQQSASIEETVSCMEEISSMIAQSNSNIHQTIENTSKSKKEGEEGQRVISKMIESMDEIEASNEDLNKIVKVIEEIQSKTKIINDIVFETRLLAFNASIEAARAGIHGKGFAVVAEEVGKLANLSGTAADEIRVLLEDSTSQVAKVVGSTQERVRAGKVNSSECESAFSAMIKTIGDTFHSIEAIGSALKEQETGVRQTNIAMQEMEKTTQSNANNASILNKSSEELSGVSRSTTNAIYDLQKLISGKVDSVSVSVENQEVPADASPAMAQVINIQEPKNSVRNVSVSNTPKATRKMWKS